LRKRSKKFWCFSFYRKGLIESSDSHTLEAENSKDSDENPFEVRQMLNEWSEPQLRNVRPPF
jgi:hypothetical protein